MALLEIDRLNVVYDRDDSAPVRAVRDITLSVAAGEFVGIVGESGCGKSTLATAVTRLLRPPARIDSGSVVFDGVDLTTLSWEELRRARYRGFAIVPQSGMNALNPVRNIEDHFAHVIRAHSRVSMKSVRSRATELLRKVGLPDSVMKKYSFELSGGMRQRVATSLVLALEPRLIVFDEPTTALDVMTQQRVIGTIRELQESEGFAALMVSHDLGVVLEATHRVLVMYGGRIVEDRPADMLLQHSRHPYTRALLDCYADPRANEVRVSGITGSPPDLSTDDEHSCSFAPRCPLAELACTRERPPLFLIDDGKAACLVTHREAESAHV